MNNQIFLVLLICISVSVVISFNITNNEVNTRRTPCTCGIFLSNQFKKGSKEQPKGNAALLQEFDRPCPTGIPGTRQCTSKCLDLIVKHLPNSPAIICATINGDCFKEKAHLFIKNEHIDWYNTNLSAGREFCCKNNRPYKCPE